LSDNTLILYFIESSLRGWEPTLCFTIKELESESREEERAVWHTHCEHLEHTVETMTCLTWDESYDLYYWITGSPYDESHHLHERTTIPLDKNYSLYFWAENVPPKTRPEIHLPWTNSF